MTGQDAGRVHVRDLLGQHRHVYTGVGLASQEKVVRLHFRKRRDPVFQERVGVFGDAGVVPAVLVILVLVS